MTWTAPGWQDCADLVQKGDPDRFAALMAARPPARPALAVLYAYNLELARAPWASKEPMIAEMRLQWWVDVVAEPTPRAHEVAGPLHALIRDCALPVAALQAMAEARRWDVWSEAFADPAAFQSYLDATSGALMALSVQALGGDAAAVAVARQFGAAAGLAGFLRAVPALEARGRLPLVDGRPAAVQALARAGLLQLHAARQGRAALRGLPQEALLAGWQTESLLRLAASDPMAVAEDRLTLSEFRRRGSLLWQALSGRW
ncbi:phytoene/squalene synthase family protein [Tabrizicola fusiformis]|uniref:phytoene/squalene synthase family protein n=1 Tax=Tabrizicola sp. SY72 TaxID=2741673 RepID=UPI0015744BD8|nr:squalene/phytoene synthase family protein [Tabrizicola sp. SY72]NTT87415.1 squalene/phytoene synthase family protein [Tabrizicola sp. SY72]